jgi:hypothetical protein
VRPFPVKSLSATLALALAVSACGHEQDEAESAEEFAQQLALGVDLSYIGMGSPRQMIAESDLVARGVLTDVFEGVEYEYEGPADDGRYTGIYLTFEVAVEEVLAGDESLVRDGKVYVMVDKANPTSPRDLAAANPRPEVLLVLLDHTQWLPDHASAVIRPERMPSDAPIFFARPDGLWLQTPSDQEMVSPFTTTEALDPTWGRPRTIDEMAEVVRACRQGDCP